MVITLYIKLVLNAYDVLSGFAITCNLKAYTAGAVLLKYYAILVSHEPVVVRAAEGGLAPGGRKR